MTTWRKLEHGPIVPQVEAMLRERLVSGRWAAGEKVPSETALATEIGVGRSSVREAVRLLSREGLLEVRHGSGTFVGGPERSDSGTSIGTERSAGGTSIGTERSAGGTSIDAGAPSSTVAELLRRARLLEVYEVRRSLEVEAARLAAHRARAQDLTGLRAQLAERAARSHDPASFVATDLDFHEAIVRLSGNSVLSELFAFARPIIQAALIDRIAHDGPLLDTDDAHDHLVDALERHDEASAVAATEANLENTMQQLRAEDVESDR